MTGRDAAAGGERSAHRRAVLFQVGDVGYGWDDVFAHARRQSSWRALETDVRAALACQRMVEDEGLPAAVDGERAAARAFRTERRLYAAEDLEEWLADRGITVAQWREYLRGLVHRDRHEEQLAAIVARYPPADDEVAHAVPGWGVCSGAFAAWARQLAERAAAAQARWERDADRPQPPGPDQLDRVDELWRRLVEESATPTRLASALRRRHLDWLRVDWEQAVFRTRDAAREGVLCVRDDGWSLAEAAAAAGTRLEPRSAVLEEVDADLRRELLRSRVGELVGPLRHGDGWAVLHVRAKGPPSLQAPEVRARALAAVADATVAGEVTDRVRWLLPL